MQNVCFSTAPSALELPAREHNVRRSLRQHRGYELTTPQAVGQRERSKSTENWEPSGRLRRTQGSDLILRAPICLRDHLLQGDKSSPQ